MKTINISHLVKIPDNVIVRVKSCKLTVKEPRGTPVCNFRHLPVDLSLQSSKQLKVEKWFGKHKELAAVNTVCSCVQNMIKGITVGFLYKMPAVYPHIPINVVVSNVNTKVETKNFLGENYVRHVEMLKGVSFKASGNTNKDEFIMEGNDIELISRLAALIQQSTIVKKKDIHKFVTEKTTVVQ